MAMRVERDDYAAIAAATRERLGEVVAVAAFNIAERAAASMEGGKSGRLYVRRGVEHQASAPGEAPAIDTGILHDSFFTQKVDELEAIVGTNVEYAPHLELGTVNIAPRPFLLPATEDERSDFNAAVASVLRSGAR